MMSTPFIIGQKVFRVMHSNEAYTIPCPDCAGTRHIRAIIADGTEFSIECGGCDPGGYQGPQGVVKQYKVGAVAQEHTVTGFRVNAAGYKYELDNFGGTSYYTGTHETLFGTKEEAEAGCEARRREVEADENKRLLSKTKNEKSWAWNLSYHRKQAAESKRQMEYHLSKVSVCAAHEGKS